VFGSAKVAGTSFEAPSPDLSDKDDRIASRIQLSKLPSGAGDVTFIAESHGPMIACDSDSDCDIVGIEDCTIVFDGISSYCIDNGEASIHAS
jgi:hypothetical protein